MHKKGNITTEFRGKKENSKKYYIFLMVYCRFCATNIIYLCMDNIHTVVDLLSDICNMKQIYYYQIIQIMLIIWRMKDFFLCVTKYIIK